MRHHAQVAHHTKGRLRIKVPSAKGNAAALEKIKQALSPVAGVREVVLNEAIGTITVHYDPKRHIDFHKHLSGEGEHQKAVALSVPHLSEVDELAETLEREAEFLSSHSQSAKVVFDFLRRCDLELKKATHNELDLKVLAPLGLAVYAFLEMGFEASTPVWLTLGLFSFNHFIDLHSHQIAAQDPDCPPVPARRTPVRSF